MIQRRLVSKVTAWIEQKWTANSPVQVQIGHRSFPEHGRNGRELIEGLQLAPIDLPKAA
jgi:hypothetical protein